MDFISASEDWSDMARDFKYHIEGQDRAAQPRKIRFDTYFKCQRNCLTFPVYFHTFINS